MMMASRALPPLLLAAALTASALSRAEAASSAWVGNQHAAVRLVTAADSIAGSSPIEAGLAFRFASGWHGYWRTPGDAGVAPLIDWSGSAGLKTASVAWPAPVRLVVAGLQNGVYDGNVVLPVRLAFADPSAAADIRVAIDYAACSDICVPYHADLSLDLPAGIGGASTDAADIAAARAKVPKMPVDAGISVARQNLVGAGSDRALVVDLRSETVPFVHPDLFVENAGDGMPGAPAVQLGDNGHAATLTVNLGILPATKEPLVLTLVDDGRSVEFAGPALVPALPNEAGVWGILLSALLGGLILNLMPCVLPVLSLKLAGLTRHARGAQGARAVRMGFAATGFGILTCYGAIALALIALKLSGAPLGWGIQFQQPWFLAGMGVVTVLFAANLFDWISIGIPDLAVSLSGAGRPSPGSPQATASRSALIEAFLAGAFATLLATPCSAPFVGTAVGFALARGATDILAIFACLGLGMALPFFAAALIPGVTRWLPRPGPWMITLRRILGAMLLGTAAWLLVILWSVAGPVAAIGSGFCLAGLLALSGFSAARAATDGRRWPTFALGSLAALAVVAAIAAPSLRSVPARDTEAWRAFDAGALAGLVAEGHTVLVDVSASWCLTCKVNELTALKTAAVQGRLSRPGTVTMRADWTRPDPSISRFIQSFARYGIPLDVVYGPGRPAGEALPELLTARGVVEALDRAAGPERRSEGSP